MLAISPGAIQNDVRLLAEFTTFRLSKQDSEWLLPAAAVAGRFMLEQTAPADQEHPCFTADALLERGAFGKWIEVDREMLSTCRAIVVGGKAMLRALGFDRRPAEARTVHAEWAEQTNVAPALDVLADAAAFIDGDGILEAARIEGSLQANWPGAQDGDPWRVALGHHDLAARGDLSRRQV